MDARAGGLEELDEVLVVGDAQLEPGRRDAEAEERPRVGVAIPAGHRESLHSPPMAEDWFEVNREMWDERVPIHVASELYDVEAFVAGRSSLRPFELAELPDVRGRTLVHPQCHFGEDTLSWARLGARVTGLDFSGPAVEAARELAARCELEAEFVEANVYDAAEALGGRRFDIVYTGLGALNWLPDVERWARVMASLVAPGGCLYLAEFHPFSHVFGDDDFTVEYPYFHDEPIVFPNTGTTPAPARRRCTTAPTSGTTASVRS